MKRLALLLAATALGAGSAFAQAGAPVEVGRPNAPDQKPAFEGQTRVGQPENPAKVKAETVAEGLPHLWGMEILPDGRMLVTAKDGEMHILSKDGKPGDAISGVPDVASGGQGGLLDVALAPDFAQSGQIYFSFSEPRESGGNGTSVARATLKADEDNSGSVENVEVIFQQTPAYDGNKHFGSRLTFAPDGKLFITVGERSDEPIRDQAQDLNSGLGKVFRINADGSTPQDNPFVGRQDAQEQIWSYGLRNVQSAALDGQGRLWTVEHGAKGGDELNRPEAGKNYGWPVITYGIAYSGRPIGEGITAKEGMEQPVYYWDPVIGPSGMAFYEGDAIPEWKNAFLVGGLVTQDLVVLHMDGDRVKAEERVPLDARIRDVKVGPDGAVYAVTESRGGASTILRITKDSAS
ncbi:PQQ-dependent sugar dehydrogenase [Mesorhizobium sp. RP14(2022)]|uniref:PQQ-dependent sugar dehydrogenase n=1 Tax=Mesorhizobium liriopis TaxID=2953882 RepID=A0ABT1C8L2_9HYPH|nr:PQQ-dependent sugar dehydrogenase [Mesorhizobium liriopis]MCO6051182.1 PQQ-dependent sugar dehydrogenase [Mesorhizobium liriopis]